jgi:hypothetical protein
MPEIVALQSWFILRPVNVGFSPSWLERGYQLVGIWIKINICVLWYRLEFSKIMLQGYFLSLEIWQALSSSVNKKAQHESFELKLKHLIYHFYIFLNTTEIVNIFLFEG